MARSYSRGIGFRASTSTSPRSRAFEPARACASRKSAGSDGSTGATDSVTALSEDAPAYRPVPFREAEIDLAQLRSNLSYLISPGAAEVFVDVGANSWGHGVEVVIPALTDWGIDRFVVARRNEAESARQLAP